MREYSPCTCASGCWVCRNSGLRLAGDPRLDFVAVIMSSRSDWLFDQYRKSIISAWDSVVTFGNAWVTA